MPIATKSLASNIGPVVVLNPDIWDFREFSRPEVTAGRPILFLAHSAFDDLTLMDPVALIDHLVSVLLAARPSGIVSTDDYPGSLIANAVAARLGLPATPMQVALTCQHKYLCRCIQSQCVPQCVPKFFSISLNHSLSHSHLPYPFFMKPIKANFQLFADVVSSSKQLAARIQAARSFINIQASPLNSLMKAYDVKAIGANRFIGESILTGAPLTVEGYAFDGDVRVLGIIDACYYRGTRSYRAFRYPSVLPMDEQTRICEIVTQLMSGLGYTYGPFNIDLLYNKRTRQISIVEVNPRVAVQLADLFEKVDGFNTFATLLDLAAGVEPATPRRSGRYAVAGSFVFRRFADAFVESIKGPEAIESRYPDARANVYYEPGTHLSDDVFQDTRSYVYSIVNLGGRSIGDLYRRARKCHDLLEARFRPIERKR
jgi:hypothetical protein